MQPPALQRENFMISMSREEEGEGEAKIFKLIEIIIKQSRLV